MEKISFLLDIAENLGIITIVPAGVAHLAERHLAKVEVASSNLVARSKRKDTLMRVFPFGILTI